MLGIGVYTVHPVTILSAVFSVIYRLLMFVSDASGDHIVDKTLLTMQLSRWHFSQYC